MYEETGILKDFLITKLITKRYMLYFISIHYHIKKKEKEKLPEIKKLTTTYILNFLKLLFKIEGTFDQLKVITIKILS